MKTYKLNNTDYVEVNAKNGFITWVGTQAGIIRNSFYTVARNMKIDPSLELLDGLMRKIIK